MLQFPGHGFDLRADRIQQRAAHACATGERQPGAPRMKVLVRDLQPVLAGLDKVQAVIVTRSTSPCA